MALAPVDPNKAAADAAAANAAKNAAATGAGNAVASSGGTVQQAQDASKTAASNTNIKVGTIGQPSTVNVQPAAPKPITITQADIPKPTSQSTSQTDPATGKTTIKPPTYSTPEIKKIDTTSKETKAKIDAANAPDYWSQTYKALSDYLKTGNEMAKQSFDAGIDGVLMANNANLQASRMRLNQAGMTGADGSAMLELIARDNNIKSSELIAQMRSDQLQKILDINKYGFEGYQKLAETKQRTDRENLNTLLQNGQYDAASSLWNTVFPGTTMDVAALKSSNPELMSQVGDMMAAADDYQKAGLFDLSKQTRAAAAKLAPWLVGETDPEVAYKKALEMDTSSQDLAVQIAKDGQFNQAIDAAISRNEMPKAREAAKTYLGAKAFNTGVSLRSSMSLEEANQIQELIGNEPFKSEADYYAYDPSELAVDKKLYDSIVLFRQTATAFKVLEYSGIPKDQIIEMAKDNESWNVIEAWVKKSLIAPSKINPDSPIGIDIDPTATDIANTVGHFFTDWPIAKFSKNADGTYTATDYTYTGYNPYNDTTNKRNDPNDQYTGYQQQLDKAWEDYVMAGAPGGFDRKTWFEVSGGGQASPKQVKEASAVIAANTYDESGFNPAGYDKEGYNKDGFNAEGYNRQGLDKDGNPKAKQGTPKAKAETFSQKVSSSINLPKDEVQPFIDNILKVSNVASDPTRGSEIPDESWIRDVVSNGRNYILSKYGANTNTESLFGPYTVYESALGKLGPSHTSYRPSGSAIDMSIYATMIKNGMNAYDAQTALKDLIGEERTLAAIQMANGSSSSANTSTEAMPINYGPVAEDGKVYGRS